MIHHLIKHKYPSFILPIVLIMALAMGGKNLAFTNDYHMFFSDDNPQLIAFDNLQDTYNKTDNIIIGLRDTTNGIFTEQNLRIIADITDKAWQTPFSTRVDSLSNYQHTYANADDLIVFDLVDIELTTLDSKHIESIATSELLLKNRLITNAKDTTGINITINLPDNEQEATIGQAQAVKFARELRDTIKKEYPQFEVFLSGVIMLNNAFPEAGQGDMQTLVPLSFLVVFILLLIILRSPILVLGALLLMVFTIVGAMGSAGHLLLPITPPMTSMPVIMLTIAVAGSVHLMMSFKKHMQLGEDKITALINAFNHNVKAITIAAITTAIGFLGLNFSEVPPFHDLGNVAAIGTVLSLFLILVFLPAWIVILPVKFKKKATEKNDWSITFANLVINNRIKILISSSVAALLFIAL